VTKLRCFGSLHTSAHLCSLTVGPHPRPSVLLDPGVPLCAPSFPISPEIQLGSRCAHCDHNSTNDVKIWRILPNQRQHQSTQQLLITTLRVAANPALDLKGQGRPSRRRISRQRLYSKRIFRRGCQESPWSVRQPLPSPHVWYMFAATSTTFIREILCCTRFQRYIDLGHVMEMT